MRREYQSLNLYVMVTPVNNSDQAIKATHPTPDGFKAAEKLILENFTLIKQGIDLLLTLNFFEPQNEELNFLMTFLHESSQFVAPVKGIHKIFRGKMFTISWCKSQTHGKTAGRFLKSVAIIKNHLGYLENIIQGLPTSEIIHKLFHSIVNNLLFTRDEFLNKPHCDFNASETAFLLISNINKTDGLIHLQPDSTFTSLFFVFTDHRQLAVSPSSAKKSAKPKVHSFVGSELSPKFIYHLALIAKLVNYEDLDHIPLKSVTQSIAAQVKNMGNGH
ncbi:hypothetical protein PSHT_13971 [Puccinia striiformis]|uniref:Tet-like 2OG-Fe(II) oxygenase domain-containing protein n=1 Tax=Puccinia striiformis TaxID=27350 RepID=A0A2S4UMN7_9BASI|nr:hypothetical protein PSHT_13971 [Puccinia striiformis]